MIVLTTSLNFSIDNIMIEHFVYHHLGEEQYYSLSEVECPDSYYVVSISDEPHMIITENDYGTPTIVTDKDEIKNVLVCYYNLTSKDSNDQLNDSLEHFEKFKLSTINESFTHRCIKFLGLHKAWCNDTNSCKNVCFHSEVNCRPVMLALRWEFLDAMVEYADIIKGINERLNATYSFSTPDEFKNYVDATQFIHSAERKLMLNPLISRWRFCGFPQYDWDSAKDAYLLSLNAYYSRFPKESLEDLGDKVKRNSEERILMFRMRNYIRRYKN